LYIRYRTPDRIEYLGAAILTGIDEATRVVTFKRMILKIMLQKSQRGWKPVENKKVGGNARR